MKEETFASALVSGIYDTKESAKEAADRLGQEVMEALHSRINPEAMSKLLENAIRNGFRENSKAAKKAFSDAKAALDYSKEFGMGNGEYYKELEAIRDRFLAENSKEWFSATTEIFAYHKSLAEDLSALQETLTKEAFETELADLKRQKEFGVITEEAYYDNLGSLRDRYFAEGTAQWYQYTEEIATAKRERLMEVYRDIASFAKDSFEDIAKEQSAFEQKLTDFATPTKTMRVKNWYPDGSALEFSYLSDFQKDATLLAHYAKDLQDIEMRLTAQEASPDFIRSLISRITAMSVREGATFSSLLANTDDKTFTEYIEGYQSLDQWIGIIGDNTYAGAYADAAADTVSYMKERLLEEGYTIPDSFFDIGILTGESFVEAFTETVQEKLSAFTDSVTAEVFSLGLAAAGTGGEMVNRVFSPTYHLYGSGETVTEQIQAAKAASVREKLAGGYG